jgi:hypothetical protein
MSVKSLKDISSSVVKFSKEMLEMPTRVAIWHSNILKEDGSFNVSVKGITEKDHDDILDSMVNNSTFGELTLGSSKFDQAADYISNKVKESHLFLSAGAVSFALIGEQLATGSITEASAVSLIAVGSFSFMTSKNIEGMIAKVSEEKQLKFPSVEEITSQVYYGNESMINAASGVGKSTEGYVLVKNSADVSDLAKNRFEEINAKKLKMRDAQQEISVSPSF